MSLHFPERAMNRSIVVKKKQHVLTNMSPKDMIFSSKKSHPYIFLISLMGNVSYRREEFTVEQGSVGG